MMNDIAWEKAIIDNSSWKEPVSGKSIYYRLFCDICEFNIECGASSVAGHRLGNLNKKLLIHLKGYHEEYLDHFRESHIELVALAVFQS